MYELQQYTVAQLDLDLYDSISHIFIAILSTVTSFQEISRDAAKSGNILKEKKLNALIITEKSKEQTGRLRFIISKTRKSRFS